MRVALALYVAGVTLCWGPVTTDAQDLSQLFRKTSSSVVVIRATGRDVGAGGETRFKETGSGVLISRDGKVMTAAHVVQSMDEVRVEFVGGEAVTARVIASSQRPTFHCCSLSGSLRGRSSQCWPTLTLSASGNRSSSSVLRTA